MAPESQGAHPRTACRGSFPPVAAGGGVSPFEPIVLTGAEGGQVQVIGECVEVLV